MSDPSNTKKTTETAPDDPAACLAPTRCVDSDHPEVIAYAERAVGDAEDDVEKAKRLFLAVRDDLRYDLYRIGRRPEDYRASQTLRQGYGWCVTKAGVLAAAARSQGIPARLGFSDVRNHLTTQKVKEAMGTDLFVYHGYAELYLNGRWVKATPAFNRSLCEKAHILPNDFDGVNDSLYHPYDADGRRHMEYVKHRSPRLDIPVEEILGSFMKLYGAEAMAKAAQMSGDADDFEREAFIES